METSQRHAYLIIAHNELLVLQTLLACLDDARNDIYLHIDAHSHALAQQFSSWRPAHAGFFLMPNPLHAGWGGLNMLRVELMLMTQACQHGRYARYHIISGVCLPLKSQDYIHHFFAQHPTTEYVSFWTAPDHLRDLDRKVRYHYFFNEHLKDKHTLKHRLTTPIRKLALIGQKVVRLRRNDVGQFRKGSVWVSITDAFCEYLVGRTDHILSTYKRMLCADEIFLQTELHHSPFASNVVSTGDLGQESLRLIDWERGYPYVWQDADLDELMSSPYLFARKFTGQTPQLLKRILHNAVGSTEAIP